MLQGAAACVAERRRAGVCGCMLLTDVVSPPLLLLLQAARCLVIATVILQRTEAENVLADQSLSHSVKMTQEQQPQFICHTAV